MLRIRPADAGNVKVARIAGHIDPARPAARDAHDAGAHRGVGLAGLRVMILRDDRIKRVGVIDQRELGNVALIELQVRDAAAVGTPLEGVADVKLLFVHPIGCAVDDVPGTVRRKPLDRSAADRFDVKIVVTNVGGARAVRRQFRVEQSRIGFAAELVPRAVGLIEDPIIERGLADHRRARVGGEEQLPGVGG